MAVIVADNLAKAYGGGQARTTALRGLDLAVEAGEALALLGPNGAGKSTVVRVLSTLVRPSAGQASIAGLDIVKEAPRVRQVIGVTQQETGLYPTARVRKVLTLHARLFGLSRGAAAGRSDEIVELMGLGKVAERRVRQLSGGMRRRLDIGLALVHRPPVLLLDEPTDSLDPISRRELWTELARLRDEGACILFASQDLEETERLADRVAVLVDGEIRRDDIPAAAAREVWESDGVTVEH